MALKNLALMTNEQIENECDTGEGIAVVTLAMCGAITQHGGDLYASSTALTDALNKVPGATDPGAAWDALQKDLAVMRGIMRDAQRVFAVVEASAYDLNRRKREGD
jgi:hypothetical protein